MKKVNVTLTCDGCGHDIRRLPHFEIVSHGFGIDGPESIGDELHFCSMRCMFQYTRKLGGIVNEFGKELVAP